MLPLVVGTLGLFLGPLLMAFGARSASVRALVDGLATSLVLGATVIWLLPDAMTHAGLWALLGLTVGGIVPLLLHQLGHESRWLGFGLVLFGAHVLLDGAALAMLDGASSLVVAVAVAAHRVPVGMAVAYRSSSQARAASVLLALSALTVLGYVAGAAVPLHVSEEAHGFMEAVVAGVLLHVMLAHAPAEPDPEPVPVVQVSFSNATFTTGGPLALTPQTCQVHGPSCGHAHHGDHGDHHHHAHGYPTPVEARASAVGTLIGGGVLVAARVATVSPGVEDHVTRAGHALLTLGLTSAPALLAGFVFAGVVSALIRPVHVQSGTRLGQAVRGVLFGLPLPICSCGVVPMYQSLIQRGVPVTAGLAFLVATPELGLDALLLSLPLLGLPLTIARVVAAVVVALAVAWMVGASGTSPAPSPIDDEAAATPLMQRLAEGLRYGLVDLVDHTLPWVMLGLAVAALAEPLVDHQALASVPAALQVPLAAIVGVPLYVCASGATPLAAVAVHKGLSAGAALTFLLAGPASNLTTFGVLSKLHGRALAFRFGVVLTLAAVVIGWSVDLVGVEVPAVAHPGVVDTHGHGWVGWISLVALSAVALASLFRMGARGLIEQITNPVHVH